MPTRLTLVLLAVVALTVPPAAAQEQPSQQPESRPPSVRVEGDESVHLSSTSSTSTSTTGNGRVTGSTTPVRYWYSDFTTVDGRLCRVRLSTPNKAVADILNSLSRGWVEGLPPCDPAPERTPDIAVDQLAAEYWSAQRQLPSPTLTTTPSTAITGMKLFLMIHGERERTFAVDNPLGDPITIRATSAYEVDWGDDTWPQHTRSQGGPYPGGDVTHVYQYLDPGRTITVTQRWTAIWSAGPRGGRLDGLRTSGTLVVPVDQIQAVRNQ